MKLNRSTRVRALAPLLAPLALGATAFAQAPVGTAFTYQGDLGLDGAPASGLFDMEFQLFDTIGSAVGPTLCANDVAVADGKFTVTLDFGAQFDGVARSLEIRVRQDAGAGCGSGAVYTTLSPRQDLKAAPYALHALSSGDAETLGGQPPAFYHAATNLTGTLPSSVLLGTYSQRLALSNPGNSLAGDGRALVNLNADAVVAGLLPIARGGTGLGAAGPAGSFLRSTGGALSFGTINAGDLPAIALGGDLTGTTAAARVAALRGFPVSASAPANGEVLKWNAAASQWAAAADLDTNTTYSAGAGLTLAGTTFVLTTDPASLARVSGNLLSVTGGDIAATNDVIADDFRYSTPQTGYVMVSEAAFQCRDGTGVRCGLGIGGAAPASPSAFGMIAPVNLPHGATITDAQFIVTDNDPSEDLSLRLIRLSVLTSGYSFLASTATTGASSSAQAISVPTNNVVNNTSFSYAVFASPSATWAGGALMQVRGVRITYTLPTPAR